MRWWTPGRRLVAAAVGAVALHLLLLGAILLVRWPEPPAVPRKPVLTVDLFRTPGRAPQAPGPPAAAPSATTRAGEPSPSPAVVRPPRTRSAPATGLAAGERGTRPGEAKGPGETAGEAHVHGPLTKEELTGEGLAREPGSVGVGTTLRDPIATLNPLPPEPKQGPVHVPTREEALLEEKTRVGELLHGWTEGILAHQRAEDPHDGYWHDMQEALAKNFDLDFDVSKRADDRPTSTVREAFSAYQRAAQSFGKTGSPLAGADTRSLNQAMAGGDVRAEDRGFAGTSLEGIKAAGDQQALAEATFSGGIAWNKKLVVQIQVIQSPDGAIEKAQVTMTSGNTVYDGKALAQVRKLAGKGILGAPPSGRRRTVWAFETDFTTMPPLPVGGCAIDAFFVPGECYYPFKRTAHSRIRLEAIY